MHIQKVLFFILFRSLYSYILDKEHLNQFSFVKLIYYKNNVEVEMFGERITFIPFRLYSDHQTEFDTLTIVPKQDN